MIFPLLSILDVLDVLEELTQAELEHIEETKANGIKFWTDTQMHTYNVRKEYTKDYVI